MKSAEGRDFFESAPAASFAQAACGFAFPVGVGAPAKHFRNLKKKKLGQFFTERNCWLLPQVKTFIAGTRCEIAYDPFAGTGCLLDAVARGVPTILETRGLDIDEAQGWAQNDSLKEIPALDGAIIVTNPPYFSNYSASRKKLGNELRPYFATTDYDDVYLLALDKMLAAQKNVVAIVPETFINSPFRQKHKLHSLSILEENPFEDTDVPVLVACFDSVSKNFDAIKVYKNNTLVCSLGDVERNRLMPTNGVEVKFNEPTGWLAVRCVDTTNPNDRIRFAFKNDIKYNWEKGLKVSSRLLTLVEIDVPESRRESFIVACNREVEKLREKSHDIVLSPFKGNMKNGVRRRRLDFQTCRAIIEKVYFERVPANELNLLHDE